MADRVTERENTKRVAIANTIREQPTTPGTALNNGAVLLEQIEVAVHDHGREYIVLAVVEKKYQPFATWRRLIGIQELATGGYGPVDYCWSGTYHRDLEDALAEFDRRVENG